MKVYYAHCIAIYNTPQEERDIAFLTELGFDVQNPNSSECDSGYKNEGMDYFKKFAVQCDAVAFRALPDSAIPAGVATEIGWFATLNKPVIELPSCISRRVLSVEATREYLRECGHR